MEYFVKLAWPVVEPDQKFLDNWHIGLICEYLEAVTALDVNNLIINIPPRHMKSLLVSVLWPVWCWVNRPGLRFLTGSYAEPLAVRDALKSRRLLQSKWFTDRFSIGLRRDQNQKHRYENLGGGYRLAFGFGGLITGEGGDVIIVDDPIKASDVDSEALRNRTNDIYDQTISTRVNTPSEARRVIIMQRLHQDDLTGHILDRVGEVGAAQYEHLVIPTEFEPGRFYSTIGKADKRVVPGELLWPGRFDAVAVAAAKVDLGARGYAGQHGQRPSPMGGTIYLSDWWDGVNRYHPENIKVIGRWLSWDSALKDGAGNDTSALTVWDLTDDYKICLRWVSWGRYEFPQLVKIMGDELDRWNTKSIVRGVVIEDKVSGTSALQTLQQSGGLISELVVGFMPVGSKEARSRQASLWCERGRVLLPWPGESVPWLYDFEKILYAFPGAKIKDPVDSFAQLVIYLEHYLSLGWRGAMGNEIN